MKNKKKILPRLSWVIIIFLLVAFPFSMALAQWTIGTGYGLPGGTLAAIIGAIVNWLLSMFAFFGVIGFIVSGIMYLVSAGNDEMIKKAKTYMTYSLVGVIVGLSGYVIIKAVDAMLKASTTF